MRDDERALLFRYCAGHPVAACRRCAKEYHLGQLGFDILTHARGIHCPSCGGDVKDELRAHLASCATAREMGYDDPMYVKLLSERLAAFLKQNPLPKCTECLAGKLGASVKDTRDAAQMLVAEGAEAVQGTCRACGRTEYLLRLT